MDLGFLKQFSIIAVFPSRNCIWFSFIFSKSENVCFFLEALFVLICFMCVSNCLLLPSMMRSFLSDFLCYVVKLWIAYKLSALETFCDTGKAREEGMPPHCAKWRQLSRFSLGLHGYLRQRFLVTTGHTWGSGSTNSSQDCGGEEWLMPAGLVCKS